MARKKADFTISFYTGGVDVSEWKNLTLSQQEKALKKTWRIRWWYRNPTTKRLERQTDIKGHINRHESMQERLAYMKEYRNAMVVALVEGYNPYSYTPEDVGKTPAMNAEKAIKYALEMKKSTVSPQTYRDYKMHGEGLIKYLRKQNRVHHDIKFISRRVVSDYLDTILKKTSAKTRNNARGNLSAIFGVLSEKYLIQSNFIKNDIPKLRVRSKTDRRFTKKQMKDISTYLKENDPYMLLFIKIVAYNFLRPIEVVRLKVSSVDLEGREMYFDQKTKLGKTKYIPEIYYDELAELVKDLPPEYYLFTPEGKPAPWETADKDKRNYWSKRFKKVKKALQIGEGYGMYSFRHSFIDMYYKYLVIKQGMNMDQACKHLMAITGHDSMDGLKNYINRLDIVKPKDYSKELKEFDVL